MVDTARKEIKFLESQRKGGAEGLSAAEVEALTDDDKLTYLDQTEKIQEFQDIIEVSLAKRKELNEIKLPIIDPEIKLIPIIKLIGKSMV